MSWRNKADRFAWRREADRPCSSTDSPRFVPGNFKSWLRGLATNIICGFGGLRRKNGGHRIADQRDSADIVRWPIQKPLDLGRMQRVTDSASRPVRHVTTTSDQATSHPRTSETSCPRAQDARLQGKQGAAPPCCRT